MSKTVDFDASISYAPRTIGLVFPEGFLVMGLAAAAVFELANAYAKQRLYDIQLLSERGGLVANSFGAPMTTLPLPGKRLDTMIVVGRLFPEPSSPDLVEAIINASKTCRRVASECSGAFILGEAGLLNGRRATTHWLYARRLQEQFPETRVEEDRIYITDGRVWTSAGGSAGIDLALALVEDDFGAEIARHVAQNLVVHHRRAGGQSQHSALLDLDAKSDRIQAALAYAKRNLSATLSVEELAEVAHLSPRQFSRAFRSETGQSPAKAVENLRLEAARVMIEQTRHAIDRVAAETGFVDRQRMRRAFMRAFDQPPQAIRRNARVVA